MQRRKFLKLAGGGVILAATGLGGFAATRAPHAARAPWTAAGDPAEDPRIAALSYAILAPNPHNLQPWIIRLDGADGVTLFFDTDRQLPQTDPFDRQLTIGLGCFLELMRMAAGALGYAVDLELFPDGDSAAGLDGRPVASAVFRPDPAAAPDPLWPHVPHRRSNKAPYDTARTIDRTDLDFLIGAARNSTAGGSVALADIADWRELTENALRIELETPATYLESVELFRIGKAEITANPDGIAFPGTTYELLHMFGLFTREAALDRTSQSYKAGIDAVLENCRTAMGHVWLVTDDNSRASQIATGADWLRVNLAATAAGLGFQPLSQALQEYPEMSDIYAETHRRLAPGSGTVQMLARIGYGPAVPPAPRWPLSAKIVRTA